jgi:hypothetical protein
MPKSAEQLLSLIGKLAPKTKDLKKEMEDGKERNRRKSSTWKPEPNKTYQIRVVPYPHSKSGSSNPFIEAYFHWNVADGQAYIVCPKKSDAANGGLGDECPICDLQKKLYATKDQTDAQIAKQIRASLRWYVPILVRGEEDKGIQFYGFSNKTYETFCQLMNDSDYESMLDPVEGYDLSLTYTKDEKKKDDFGTVTILPKPKTSAIIPIPKDADEEERVQTLEVILALLNSVPNFFEDVFKPKSVEDLQDLILKLDEGSENDAHSHETKEAEDVYVDDDSDVAPPVDDDDDKPSETTSSDEDEDDEKAKAERSRKLSETLGKFKTGVKK